MKTVITYKVIILKDSHGNIETFVMEDTTEYIGVHGMKDKDYKDLYFESEAYNVFKWCDDNDIEYKVVKMEAGTVEDLWKMNTDINGDIIK